MRSVRPDQEWDPRISARDLPQSPLSDYLEKYMRDKVGAQGSAQQKRMAKVTVRVISNYKDENQISEKIAQRYKLNPKISFMQKLIYVFYEPPDGREICFFGIQVQEYGPDCPPAQRNSAYLAYIDSANLYHVPECAAHSDKVGVDVWTKPDGKKVPEIPCTRPQECKEERKQIYQSLMHGYMQYLRLRHFKSMWIWVMPPSAELADQPQADYMFNYRPSSQHIPNQKQLEKWYMKLLQTAQEAGIVEYFLDNTGLRKEKVKEKLKRNIDFAFTADHNRPTSPAAGGAAAAAELLSEFGMLVLPDVVDSRAVLSLRALAAERFRQTEAALLLKGAPRPA
eukprot:SAG22_NODE_3527_length_1661_cov_0.921895_2_plen_339_part_00